MAIKVKPLSATEIKAARPTDKEYNLSDGEGLMLRIKPSGSKLWLFNYRHPITKKRKNLSLGQYPALSLADARKLRIQSKELLNQGHDPKEYRDDQRVQQSLAAGNTLKNVTLDWFELKKTKIAEVTAISILRTFENHLFPKVGHRAIDKLLAPEAIAAIKPLAAKGSLETASKLIGHLNEVMTYAVNTGLIHHNPLAGIKSAFETPKATHMLTIKPEELPELMKALCYASIKLTTRCLIEWQLHTLVRPSEASGTTWAEIDLEQKIWTIPAERMKKKRQHIVPLTRQAIEILNRMKPLSSHRVYVFPSDRKPNLPSNPQTANGALKRMGFKNRLVAHGMRSIGSTALNEHGFDGDVVEAALAHVDKNEVRRAYNRAEYLERRKTMMCWWSSYIEQAERGTPMITSNVTEFKMAN